VIRVAREAAGSSPSEGDSSPRDWIVVIEYGHFIVAVRDEVLGRAEVEAYGPGGAGTLGEPPPDGRVIGGYGIAVWCGHHSLSQRLTTLHADGGVSSWRQV